MTDANGQCVVVAVANYLLFKRVSFRAQRDCSYSRLMLRLGDRAKFPVTRLYSLSAGSTVSLPYPFWKSLQPGDVVSFSSLAMHPLAGWKDLHD